MFKSIQYKLYLFTALLMLAVGCAVSAFFLQYYALGALCILLMFICLSNLNTCYNRYNRDVIFLLNALENGDYTFHFAETKLSAREQDMYQMMNRIKEILANARKEVVENENFLSLIIESVSTGILIIDDRGIVHRVNQTALNMLGLHVFSHVNQLHVLHESYPELFHRLRADDKVQISLTTEREELQISLQVSQIRLKRGMMRIITMNNIGNELEMKEMESWIRLIRVMTHEIMNFIAPITSLSETMHSLLRTGDLFQSPTWKQNTIEVFETIHTTAAGLLSFVESYRKFTAIPKPEKLDFNLTALVEKVVKLYEFAMNEKNIELETVYPPENIFIHADENLISQALINLVKNAVEAVEAGSRQKIRISLYRYDLEKTGIDVANTGQPIPPDVLPHIFIPFFTTKSSGSGVGLSLSRYIMRLHGGKLQHSRSKDEMTVFSMIFG